jgi:hypothetical protein
MPSDSSFGPSSALVTAALAGLLGLTAACSSDAKDPAASKDPITLPDGGQMEPGEITSSVVDETMTLEKFTADCDTRGGKIEIHPGCHGANTCKGLSYDDGTFVLTEHTCAGLNTCSGYSCVVPM